MHVLYLLFLSVIVRQFVLSHFTTGRSQLVTPGGENKQLFPPSSHWPNSTRVCLQLKITSMLDKNGYEYFLKQINYEYLQ